MLKRACLIFAAMLLAQPLAAQEQQAADEPQIGEVNPNRFGKRTDAAFGAFQRGLYITALRLATPRAEAGDAAAQTLIAEIHARGSACRAMRAKRPDGTRKRPSRVWPKHSFNMR